MANNKIKYFILTGDPGVGKTTLTQKLITLLREKGVQTSGFYTEEVRKNRVREGFDVISLSGQRACLARDLSLLNVPSKHKVGKYGVLIQEFESVALPSLKNSEKGFLVIDEIGKMEFFSEQFKNRIKEIFNSASPGLVLATIPVRKGDLLTESIRNHKQAKVWMVTRDNRNNIQEDIIKEMSLSLN